MANLVRRFIISLLSKSRVSEAAPEEVMIDKNIGEIVVKAKNNIGTPVSYDYISRTESGVADFMRICKSQGLTEGTIHKIELKDQLLYPIEVEADTNLMKLFVRDAIEKLTFEKNNAPLMDTRMYIDATIMKEDYNAYISTEPIVKFTVSYDGLILTSNLSLSVFNRTDLRKHVSHHIAKQASIVNKSAYDPSKAIVLESVALLLTADQQPVDKYKIILHNIFTLR